MSSISTAVLVLSGKGGVGKSTVSSQLALALARSGKKVGLLDIDLSGPSIPRMMGLEGHKVHQCPEGWVPVQLALNNSTEQQQEQQQEITGSLSVMSIGFLLDGKDDPVIWRGPKRTAMVRQFVQDVYWQQIDCLIVDTPPGTTDEHMAIVEALSSCQRKSAIVVTTPQLVAIGDVRRELGFCEKVALPVAGILENMSGFSCPNCAECTNIFSSGGGQELARAKSIKFLGTLPIQTAVAACADDGKLLQAPTLPQLQVIAESVLQSLNENN